MKYTLRPSDFALLAGINGKFDEPPSKRYVRYALAGLFGLGGTALYLVIAIAKYRDPLSMHSDPLIFFILALTHAALGMIFFRFGGDSYIFDGTSIRQLNSRGVVWKQIKIQDISTISFRRLKGVRSMQLATEGNTMGVILYPNLLKEINQRRTSG